MEGIIITTGDSIRRINIDYNDLAESLMLSISSLNVDSICELNLVYDESHIEMIRNFPLSPLLFTFDNAYSGTEFIIIKEVNGAAPTSQENLFDLIKDIIK